MRRIMVLVSVVLMALTTATPAGARGATTQTIRDFETVVAVSFADNEFGVLLMYAQCSVLHRVERPDGSARETQTCQVTEPFDIYPGEVPATAFNDTGGECIWYSDFWGNQDPPQEFYASSYKQIVTPSGKVHATSEYAADPLSAADCGFAGE